MTSRLEPEYTTPTIWTWGTNASLHEIGHLNSVSKPDGYAEAYTFDNIGRNYTTTYTEDGDNYTFGYAYNAQGMVSTLTYPASTGTSPFALKYVYDSYGYLNQLQDANAGTTFWTLSAANDANLPTTEVLGNGVALLSSYTPWTNELVTRQEGTSGSDTNIQNLSYTWDKNGNLSQRQDLRQNLTEAFTPDAMNRLTTVTLNGTQTLSMSYDASGNISSKSDVGTYAYGDGHHPHAVTAAGTWVLTYDANGNALTRAGGAITWYSYNLPNQITYSGNSTQFMYDANHQRWRQIANYGGTTETTHYVGGLFEVVGTGSATSYRHMIPAGSSTVVYTRATGSGGGTFYATSDHLGSADVVMDASANVLVRESFTPFGARRGSNWQGVPTSTDYTNIAATTRHGYTGHEMLDSVSLVHMNGRVYDPFLARFVSADTVIQSLGASESINPYAYAWNDPLKYVDPTGHSLLGDILGVLAFVAVTIFLPELEWAVYGATLTTPSLMAVAGFVGGFVGAMVSTGSLSAALTAGLISGLTAGLTAGIAQQVLTSNWTPLEGVLARVAVGCASSAASGGNCGSGAVSSVFEIAAQPLLIKFPSFGQWGQAPEAVQAGLIGGEAAKLAGGKFEDGFSTAAIQYLATAANSPQQDRAASSATLGLAGKIWSLPNTVIGLGVGTLGEVVGWIGYVFGWVSVAPGVTFGPNAIVFTNNPLMFRGAITFGNVEIYGALEPGDDDPMNPVHTVLAHETQHTYQAQELGPLYLPLAGISLLSGILLDAGNSHGPAAFMETGPQQDVPRPW
jgi:RHS repeat-associated protein